MIKLDFWTLAPFRAGGAEFSKVPSPPTYDAQNGTAGEILGSTRRAHCDHGTMVQDHDFWYSNYSNYCVIAFVAPRNAVPSSQGILLAQRSSRAHLMCLRSRLGKATVIGGRAYVERFATSDEFAAMFMYGLDPAGRNRAIEMVVRIAERSRQKPLAVRPPRVTSVSRSVGPMTLLPCSGPRRPRPRTTSSSLKGSDYRPISAPMSSLISAKVRTHLGLAAP